MSDLIDRWAAIDAIFEAFSTGDEGADRYIAEKILANVPSAQPEIIRCKDCKHQRVFHYTDKRFKDPDRYVYGCDLMPDGCYLNCFDSYCSEAERRTDE